MASLELITVFVLAILIRACTSELHYPKHHQEVVYVPVCTPECAKPAPSHCPQQQGYYHQANHQQYYGRSHQGQGDHQQYFGRSHQGQGDHQQYFGRSHQGQGDHQHYYGRSHQGQADHQQYFGGSQQGGRSHQHGTSVHHGSGVSHQSVQQHHPPGGGEGLHGGEEGHHKKDAFYRFEYSVNDHKTGDVKRHREERQGDAVNGEYSLLEEDGNVRTVKYYADWKTGFHAQVHNSKG